MAHLIIPIRIEALLLEQDIDVCPPLADFTKLPWYNEAAQEPVNAEYPYLGSTIDQRPFGSANLTLKAGLHLHFMMPQFLGRVSEEFMRDGKACYPALPNRFLVVRRRGNTTEKKWLVESDFVHPVDYTPEDGMAPALIPVKPVYSADHLVVSKQPYRYMGRQMLLEGDTAEFESSDTFEGLFDHDLTVLGYGDINFTSFYPNCLGVFGFYDAEITTAQTDVSYEVFGFYVDSTKDLIVRLAGKGGNPEDLPRLLQEKLQLTLKNQLDALPADGSLLWGKVVVDGTQGYIKKQDSGGVSEWYATLPDGLEVAMGSTGSEALSVVLANKLSEGKAPEDRDQLEALIESILLHPKLSHHSTDLLAKTKEARHEKGFKPVHGGNAWVLRGKQGAAPQNSLESGNLLEKLPSSIVDQFTLLNETQTRYDAAQAAIRGMKEQLYLDWWKYLQTKHRPEDTNSAFDYTAIFTLLTDTNRQISNQVAETGSLKVESPGGQYTITANGNLASTIQAAVETLNDLLKSSSTIVTDSEGKPQTIPWNQLLDIQFVPDSGFWEPGEPVILIEGLDDNADKLTDLSGVCFGADGLESLRNYNFAVLPIIPDEQKNNFPNQNLSHQNWKPFIMEWQISLFSTQFKNDPANDFLPDTFAKADQTANFNLDEYGPDVVKSAAYREYSSFSNEQVFSGRTILSGHTKDLFRKRMEQFLTKAPDNVGEDLRNPYHVAKKILDELPNLRALSQVLGGFNAACLTRSQTMQLPVFDPLESLDETNIDIQAISNTLNGGNRTSPMPQFYFNPFRSGTLKDVSIRFIDNFGIPSARVTDNTILPALSFRDEKGGLFARPRVIQPMRLNLDWITPENKKCHFLGSSSALHGWLVPNLLDNEIMVYDAGGQALGYLDSSGDWVATPWSLSAGNLETDVKDKFLKGVVAQMQGRSSQFVDLFQAALDHIAPTAQKSDTDTALLIGRPIAVARIGLSLQLNGLRVLGQEWTDLKADLAQNAPLEWAKRSCGEWSKMKFPYRLGEHGQLNDGLVGYWLEDAGQIKGPLYTPQVRPDEVTGDTGGFIKTFGAGAHLFHTIAPDDPQQNITLLLDPRGLVHATTGILPVKNIALPVSAYDDVVKKMKVWFKTGPLIQAVQKNSSTATTDRVYIDMPVLEGFEWSWYDKHPDSKTIQPTATANPLQGHISILEGYLNLSQIKE